MKISDPDFQLPAPLPLPADEVHLWQVDLAAMAPAEDRLLQILSGDERTRAARFHAARDRRTFAVTRGLLRTILASYLNTDAATLAFHYPEKGKPRIADTALEFNVSHSGDQSLLAFARSRAIGVDVEIIRHDFDCTALAERFFSLRERTAVAALDPQDRFAGFFRCWTRKEAYIKAHGSGLSLPLHEFDVSLAPGDQNALLAVRSGDDASRWSLSEVSVAPGYAGALCVEGSGWTLKI